MTFEVVDDVALALHSGRLDATSPVTLLVAERLGPLVEFLYLRQARADRYRCVEVPPTELSRAADAALTGRRVSGTAYGSATGFLPLARRQPHATDQSQWEHWCLRTQQAAERSGVPKTLAQSLIAALQELEDNVHVHSGAPATAIVGYVATDSSFEFVVADGGIGVLQSLRQAPEFAGLTDGGEALRLALSDGISRFGRASDRGYGFRSLFTALAGHDGALRFRSGDHALTIAGAGPTLALATISQKAPLAGFIVSVLCPSGMGRTGGSRPGARTS